MALSGAQVTQHGVSGYSQIRYGDFSGKTEAVNSSPTDIVLSKAYVLVTGGLNAIVGTLTTTDADPGDSHTYTLVAGTGDTDNANFNISGSTLRCDDPETLGVGTYSVRIQTDDGVSTPYAEAFSVEVRAESARNIVLSPVQDPTGDIVVDPVVS